MNKFLKALVFAGTIVTVSLGASNAEAATKYGEKLLEKGSQGSEVVALQQDLRILGYFTYPSNTGYYGEITEGAVKAFQKDHGIQETGKVGPTTAPQIEEAAAKKAEELKQAQSANADAAETAKQFVGVPYAWGGSSPSGFDCSGFVRYVFAQKGIELPRTSQAMFEQGSAVSELQPGDLVFFTTYAQGATHVGIYIGDQQFISATSSHGVKIDSFSSSYWGPRYIGAKRI
ncbi:C40 family peptidase [Effusibacillus consociatus]|uniref:C40 family peptidase n=1 Tax=Effusibacillus consociatus TaxID=1117041 RepID=A0ABV9Q166_9BACL